MPPSCLCLFGVVKNCKTKCGLQLQQHGWLSAKAGFQPSCCSLVPMFNLHGGLAWKTRGSCKGWLFSPLTPKPMEQEMPTWANECICIYIYIYYTCLSFLGISCAHWLWVVWSLGPLSDCGVSIFAKVLPPCPTLSTHNHNKSKMWRRRDTIVYMEWEVWLWKACAQFIW